MANKSTSSTKKGGYEQRESTGVLFYDAPGACTMQGNIRFEGKTYAVNAEPANDKQEREYLRITGQGVSGALYAVENIQSEKSPDFTGPIEFAGVKKRMAAWRKQIKNGQSAGQDFLSLSINEIRAKGETSEH